MITRVHYPKFSDAEMAARWQRIRDEMANDQLDCLVIYGAWGSTFGNDPGQANLRYVTNFADQFHAYCVFPRTGDPTLITSFKGHVATAREITAVPDIRFASLQTAEKTIEVLREKGMEKARIGIVGASSMRGASLSVEAYEMFKRDLPAAEWTMATKLIEKLRRNKSPEETEFLRRGAAITDRAFAGELAAIKPGARNIDCYNAMMNETHIAGGNLVFILLGSTPMDDPNMSFPDAYISDRTIERGDVVVNEHSSSYGGYSGQMLRTIFIGPPNKHYQKLFEIGLETFHRMKAAIKPGATTADVVRAASPITDNDLTVTAPLLHGWGNFMEGPLMGVPGSGHPLPDWTFAKGDTIVIEPNPCTKDLKSGVFLGDLFIVTDDGCESLHTYPIDEPIIVNGF